MRHRSGKGRLLFALLILPDLKQGSILCVVNFKGNPATERGQGFGGRD